MKIAEVSSSSVNQLWASAEARIARTEALEEAAQELARRLHESFSDSVALARVFVTVPFGKLPSENQEFVRRLARSAGRLDALHDDTPVLSLIGTHGWEEAWKDRRKSEGHVGIPLISAEFVGGIPMISRLLKEMGVPLEWIDTHDAGMMIETIGSAAGLFFVDDAGSATDGEGRKIIAAQDFVAKHSIQSVFGIGGAYGSGQMIVIVAFCRDGFERQQAEEFLPVATLFKSRTASLVEAGHIFS